MGESENSILNHDLLGKSVTDKGHSVKYLSFLFKSGDHNGVRRVPAKAFNYRLVLCDGSRDVKYNSYWNTILDLFVSYFACKLCWTVGILYKILSECCCRMCRVRLVFQLHFRYPNYCSTRKTIEIECLPLATYILLVCSIKIC